MALSGVQILLMIGMLVTGSINTLSKKAQNDCVVEGYPDRSSNNTTKPHEFDHPWFQTWIMFIGEMCCLIGLCIARRRERQAYLKKEALSRKQEGEVLEPLVQKKVFHLIFLIPTLCDLVGTSLAGIGLLYVDASVWQMLRGSIIIFAGILSKIFLKRKLQAIHWLGMIVTMLGLVLVGCSSVFQNHHGTSASHTLLGIALIIGSQLVSASQMVIEELFLKSRNFNPLQVVGMEGTFGFLTMSLAVLPAMYFIPGPQVNDSYENSLDALYQIANSSKLLIFCLLYLVSIAFYNYFGLSVTKSLTAVHRTLIDACRTILVWAADLVTYYAFDKNFGEPFDKSYGLLQVDGFLFLLIGTALYNQLVDLSWIHCLRKLEELKPVDTTITVPSPKHIQRGDFEESYQSFDEHSRLIDHDEVEPSYS
ncbi:solute carrier family 35 member F6-like [Gigantopelta aegis]|uniref:solute carrier family 35 member F6-like n=1 Tax=Gigantopelta aegis TaxID=1735272 RepID=UPI001B8873EA|nr:solute carrier family 35 member F6-like [Gigantopelta aegis]